VLGVWMAQEQRDSFSSVLKNNKGDIETLLQHIRNQVIDVDPAEDVGTNG
jgi:phospholipid transport system substrate-binding protein